MDIAAATPGRGHNGQYTRTEETAERDAEAARLRSRGWSYQQIADELGYAHHSNARKAVKRALEAIVAEPAEDLRQIELGRLDAMWQIALAVLERYHVTVSNGRLITIGGKPLEDDGPVLAALDRLLKIQERRARLLGLDAPARTHVTVTDSMEAEIERLVAQLADNQPTSERAPS
jgi:hypothetical protein